MLVYKYTPALQQKLGAKTKSEPWLHCVVNDGEYAIYVWDTRQIVESGKAKSAWQHELKGHAVANDNHMPLQGTLPASFKHSDCDMRWWPSEHAAKAAGIRWPSDKEIEDTLGRWQFRGPSFFGNGAFWASHAKAIATRYHTKPNFNELVVKCCIAMMTDRGSYNGYSGCKPVDGPTFNDILFNIDRRATNLAKQIIRGK